MVVPQLIHLWQFPLGTVIEPHSGQVGASLRTRKPYISLPFWPCPLPLLPLWPLWLSAGSGAASFPTVGVPAGSAGAGASLAGRLSIGLSLADSSRTNLEPSQRKR